MESCTVNETEVKEMAANKYAGTQTEKNLQEAFAGESRQEISIPILLLWPGRKAMSRCQPYF